MKNFMFLFVFLWLGVSVAKSVDTNCLWEANQQVNIEIVGPFVDGKGTILYIDTCGLKNGVGRSFDPDLGLNVTFNQVLEEERRFYSKGVFLFEFEDFPFDTAGYDLDTLNYFTINDLNSNYSDEKIILQNIEIETGMIKFYKNRDRRSTYQGLIKDGEIHQSLFYVEFENIVNCIEIAEDVNNNSGIKLDVLFGLALAWPTNSVFEQNNQIQIYPNPAGDMINITYPYKVKSLKLTSLNGETLKEFSRTEIAQMNSNGNILVKTIDFTPGVYFVIIDNQYFEKFIVEP